MKRKPCGRPIKDALGQYPCAYERMAGKQQCVWHWLLKQAPHVQKAYADQRRTRRLALTQGVENPRVPKDDWPPGERFCAGCQSFVPLFYCQGSRCRSCSSSAAHGARVEKTFGITAEQYDELLRRQGGRCAICRNKPRTMRLAVDHDHRTDEVRGLLCKRCNHDLLGGGHDSIAVLWRAVSYLVDPPAQRNGEPPVGHEEVMARVQRHLALLVLRERPKVEQKPPPF